MFGKKCPGFLADVIGPGGQTVRSQAHLNIFPIAAVRQSASQGDFLENDRKNSV